MKILLTGATGYIGKRLLPVLADAGHDVVCCVRDKRRFNAPDYLKNSIKIVEVDFLDKNSLVNIPSDIDAAYYLIHSMTASTKGFAVMEQESALNFVSAIAATSARQIVYLSGIVNEEHLSPHLQSRKNVEAILNTCSVPCTTLRAGIIIGSGSASFEIMRDLVEKLPVMIAPRWLKTRCQPISVSNVLEMLIGVLLKPEYYNQSYDIGGNDVLMYKDMLLRFACVRGLKRRIFVVPVMTPKLSSYWLYFVTSTSYPLAQNLVDSMKVEVVCRPNNLAKDMGIELIPYDEAIRRAFDVIDQNQVVSSWTDAIQGVLLSEGLGNYVQVPSEGCFKDIRTRTVSDAEGVLSNIWAIGGERGWYYGNLLWSIRGFMDRLVGGVGIRRGRKNADDIQPGESLDFWRVLLADKKTGRLLLYAEMKLPGEAWLEFRIKDGHYTQTATFRPLGLWGRLYWYAVLPFHAFVFEGMARNICKGSAYGQRR